MELITVGKINHKLWEVKEKEGDWLNRMNQLNFLVSRGLKPDHHLLDVGSGWLRSGIECIKYLDNNRYYGFDSVLEYVKLGYTGLEKYNLNTKNPTLGYEKRFDVSKFNQEFDFAFANSIFTHLHPEAISLCIKNVVAVLKNNGKFFATFYMEPSLSGCGDNPYGFYLRSTQPFSFYEQICKDVCDVTFIGDWVGSKVSYGQQMVLFE